jgi:prepilin-type N-terminal cleavage/methylation domain-containing protein
MKTRHHPTASGFTLLEVVVVLVIVALVLSAVYSLASGTLTLADDVQRGQRRDSREQAFATFCEHLMMELPSTAALNLKTTQEGGLYLCALELEPVPSPFDATPDCKLTLFTEAMTGGGLRLMLSVQKSNREQPEIRVMLFENLTECGWRVFDTGSEHWTTVWNEDTDQAGLHLHPQMLEWSATRGAEKQRRVFWIPPDEPVSAGEIQESPLLVK